MCPGVFREGFLQKVAVKQVLKIEVIRKRTQGEMVTDRRNNMYKSIEVGMVLMFKGFVKTEMTRTR